MAKLGRHKKEILEAIDLQAWHKFQRALTLIAEPCRKVITPSGMSFTDEFLVNENDDLYSKTIKALKFKHYVLHKDLTQDECAYFIDIDSKGTKPSRVKRLTKASIGKIERRACEKLRKALGKRFNIFELSDVYDVARHRHSVEEMTFDTGVNTGLSDGEKEFLK